MSSWLICSGPGLVSHDVFHTSCPNLAAPRTSFYYINKRISSLERFHEAGYFEAPKFDGMCSRRVFYAGCHVVVGLRRFLDLFTYVNPLGV
jgi:hypothetical protein